VFSYGKVILSQKKEIKMTVLMEETNGIILFNHNILIFLL